MNESESIETRRDYETGTCNHCGKYKLVMVEYKVMVYPDHEDYEPVDALCYECQDN